MEKEIILKSKFPSREIPLKSIGELVWDKLKERDENEVLFIEASNGRKAKVKEFLSEVNSIAKALLERGVTKSDRIYCSCTNSLSNVVIELVAFFLGVTLIPLCPTYNKYEIEEEIKNSGITIIFTSVKDAQIINDIVFDCCGHQNIDTIKVIIVFDGNYKDYLSFEQLLEEEKDERLEKIPYFEINPKNDVLVVLKTSGSTGTPKSAIYTHYMVAAVLLKSVPGWDPEMPARSFVLVHNCIGHLSGFMFLISQIIFCNTIVLFGEDDDDLMLRSVEKYKINLLPVLPRLTRKLIEGELVDKYDLSSVKKIVIGWRATPQHVIKAILEKYDVQINQFYGMTEYPRLSGLTIKNITGYEPNNVGLISVNTELKIIDMNTGQSLGPNIGGEICVRGPKMFSGYLNNEKATKEAIDSEGWFHSEDFGYYDENGRLHIVDRRSAIIKYFSSSGVHNISPVELELLLESHESVAEVAVVGVKHISHNQWPRAYVKLKEGKKASENDLEKFIADSMSATKQLRAGTVFVDHIQRTYTGKIDRTYFKNLVKNEIIQ